MAEEKKTKLYTELEKYVENLDSPPKVFERGNIIRGKVVQISKGEMLVDVGGRAEGVVSGKEMKLDSKKLDKKPG
ncbi:S1 RNA-binding domain-containing protein, partial [Candidatus Dojkabacteria bacterium]|nr:S1 RNA-binding domain-containing protein [Candidatus Dojkabacteria bacterium]